MKHKDIHLELLRKIELNPECTQGELSQEMGVSLGKINYCMKKLFEKGLIKLSNFRSNSNKSRYIYLLTPKGIEQKTKFTISFIERKSKEYDDLKAEIQSLHEDIK